MTKEQEIALAAPLSIEDIDFRVQSINKGGYATILAYKDARVDMKRLDEVLGVTGWQRDHKELKGVIYSGVSVRDSDGFWLTKWDAGTESMAEGQKGEASDSFKRACFNLGIGRELYDYPLISVKLYTDEFQIVGGKAKQTYNLKMKEWKWFVQHDGKKVSYLGAKDGKGKVRFQFGTIKK